MILEQRIWMLPDRQIFLRQRTRKVKNIGAAETQLSEDFLDTWNTVSAYGIAAPQIGSGLRAFIWKAQEMEEPEVIFNPKILRALGAVKDYDGCLSVPGFYCPTRRAELIELTGLADDGRSIRRKYEGFDARILQHEIDHLEGVLFIDRIDDLDEGYTIMEGSSDEEGEVVVEHQPASEELRQFIVRYQRPIPGHALVW